MTNVIAAILGTALVGEMLLNGPRPIGWSQVTCTLLDIHSPLATGPRIICTRMPRLRATAVAATDMTSPFYTVTVKVYTRAPGRVKVNSDRARRAIERERTSPGERGRGTASTNESKFTSSPTPRRRVKGTEIVRIHP